MIASHYFYLSDVTYSTRATFMRAAATQSVTLCFGRFDAGLIYSQGRNGSCCPWNPRGRLGWRRTPQMRIHCQNCKPPPVCERETYTYEGARKIVGAAS